MGGRNYVNTHVVALNARIGTILNQYPILQLVVVLMGVFLLAKICLKCLCLQSKLFFRRKHRLTDFGEWAVITGATDGIGKAIALRLAQKGMKIFLISRSEDRLKQTAEEIKNRVPTVNALDWLEVDFSEGTTEQLFTKLEKHLKDLDIGVLVNNVGISYPCPLYYEEVDIELLDKFVTVNVRAPLVMTRVVYPGMRERHRGAIICIGSGSSVIPNDLLYCAYSGTKGAAEHFCRSLQAECASNNIVVQCQTPLLVTTKMSKQRRTNFFVISPESYAKAAVAAVENAAIGDETSLSPHWRHSLVLWFIKKMPVCVWNYFNEKRMRALYKRALAKRQLEVSDGASVCICTAAPLRFLCQYFAGYIQKRSL